ncbi:MAG: NAD(P)H-dependent flavin oxidoreductase [Gemmatimonadales bacterium]
MRTPLCRQLGISYPIVQAPIGSATTPALAAAVSNAGGLGMLALSWRTPDEIRAMIRETRRLTRSPFGANLVLAWDQRERLATILDEGIRIISLAWGDPASYLAVAHQYDATVLCTVGSVAEAVRVRNAGADAVVAQGWESGGHVCGEVSSMVLIPAVCDAIGPTPVIAAGGIADGRGLAAAITLGAQAGWIGTRFLASSEAHVHPVYQDRILAAAETDTVYSTLFDVGWPDAPHRTLRNETVARWEAAGRPTPPARPGEGEVVAHTDGRPVQRYEDAIPLPTTSGDPGALALYAGQSAGLIRDTLPAGTIVGTIVTETRSALSRSRVRPRQG